MWTQEIKLILGKVYDEYCPNKLSKIDKLLAKYMGREEEFVAFVFDKYNVPYERMAKYRQPQTREFQAEERDEPTGDSVIMPEPAGEDEESKAEEVGGGRLDEVAAQSGQEDLASDSHSQQTTEQACAPSRPDRSQPKLGNARDVVRMYQRFLRMCTFNYCSKQRKHRGNDIRSASPPHRRAGAAWRGDPEDDEAFK